MLLRSLKIMRKATADVSNRPTDGDVVAMIKLANSSVSLSALSYLKPQTLQDKALGFISRQIHPLCAETGSWIDAYWLTLKFHELFEKNFNENPEHLNGLVGDVRAHIEQLRKLQEQRFYNNVVNGSLNVTFSSCFSQFSDEQILLWFRSGGSSLLHDEALYRLWDKLSAGESIGVILKCTVIELVSQLNQQWSPSADSNNSHASTNLATSGEAVANVLLTRDVQLKAVNFAIENVSRMGFFSARKE